MQTYTVRSGDTLGKIAALTLGNGNQWRLLADLNRITDPAKIRVGQQLVIPDPAPVAQPRPVSVAAPVAGAPAVATPQPASAAQPKPQGTVRIHVEGKTVFAIGEDNVWNRVGLVYRSGLSRIGSYEPDDFIAANAALLATLSLTPSEIAVMAATAENEGNFDAVNTYDNQYLSFGMFQWTCGSAGAPGELGALLQRIKVSYPADFEHFFGRFGLDVDLPAGAATTAWMSLDGQRLVTDEQKSQLRTHLWAYRFALAGSDPEVQAVEVAHAVGRIRSFYRSASKQLGQRSLSELITSEYGVALLLDNHVNRPGYVVPCVASAMAACGTTADALAAGSEALERQVLDAYLTIRETYGKTPMTNAKHRAEVTGACLARGAVSAARRSFKSGGV